MYTDLTHSYTFCEMFYECLYYYTHFTQLTNSITELKQFNEFQVFYETKKQPAAPPRPRLLGYYSVSPFCFVKAELFVRISRIYNGLTFYPS